MKTGKIKDASLPNIPRSYSINEILEAGGAAEFAKKWVKDLD